MAQGKVLFFLEFRTWSGEAVLQSLVVLREPFFQPRDFDKALQNSLPQFPSRQLIFQSEIL